MCPQGVQHIHSGAEIVQTRIGEALLGQNRLDAACGDADALVLEVGKTLISGRPGDAPAVVVLPSRAIGALRVPADIALCSPPVVAHHGGDLNLKQHVGKGQSLVLFLRIEQVRHDAVNAAPFRGGDDTAEVVDLELQLRAQPAGEAMGQLDVISRQLIPDIIGIGHHRARCAHAQRKRGVLCRRDVRQGLLVANDPSVIHVVQRAVRLAFPDEGVQPLGEAGDRGYRRDGYSDPVYGIVRLQQAHAFCIKGNIQDIKTAKQSIEGVFLYSSSAILSLNEGQSPSSGSPPAIPVR